VTDPKEARSATIAGLARCFQNPDFLEIRRPPEMCMQRPLQHLEINLNAQCCLVQVATSNEMVPPKIEIPFSGLVIREGVPLTSFPS